MAEKDSEAHKAKLKSGGKTEQDQYETGHRMQIDHANGLEWLNYSGNDHDTDFAEICETEDSIHLLNEALIKYFIHLSKSKGSDETINLKLLNKLIQKGAKVNTTDKHGQTLLHEAARSWHIDVAAFLIEKGANVNLPDKYGRTPLHVAAALNHVTMIELLLQNDAVIDARTTEELQTPLHYGAKYDAVNALQCLHKNGANIHAVDYQRRTPLYIAALLGRIEAATFLLNLGCDAGALDAFDQSCLNIMLLNMPQVAYDALNQFHLLDHSNRIQFFYLKYLEPDIFEEQEKDKKQTLNLIVNYQRYNLIKHPVIQHFINLKWKKYGFIGAFVILLSKFFFIITWTIFMAVIRWEKKKYYMFPQDWWRLVLGLGCFIQLALFVGIEVINYIKTKRRLKWWKKNEKQKILRDKIFCHPCWPLEASIVKKNLNDLESTKLYSLDIWYLHGWLVVVLLLAVLVTHVTDVILQENMMIGWLHLQLVVIALPPLWLWNMKNFRPFKFIGPFVIMIGKIIPVIFKFLFLYVQIFVPFGFAFYLIYGGSKELPEFSTLSNCLFTMFRISIVDSYNYQGLYEEDEVMTYVLLGAFIGLEVILAVNLFIAMLNYALNINSYYLQENIYMQKARILLYIEKLPYFSTRAAEFHNYIHVLTGPVVEASYTEEKTVEEENYLKVTIFEIKTELDQLMQKIEKDAHHHFLQGLQKLYGEEEVMGKTSTALSEQKVLTIMRTVTNLQKSVTMLHRQQDDSYVHLKNNIEKLSNLLEMELNDIPRMDDVVFGNVPDVENRPMAFLKFIKKKLTHRSTHDNEDT